MKRYIITLLFLLSLVPITQADGPPVKEDGTITTEHAAFKIETSQIKQLETTHTINLTPSQHSVLKKYYNKLPNKFVVVTPHYNECVCDLIYLIWNKADTIVLPLNSVGYFKELLTNKKYPYDYQGLLKNWGRQKIIIDTSGNLYFRGKNLTPSGLKDLFKNLSKSKDKNARWIATSLPPYLKTKYEAKVTSAIVEIDKVAVKYEVKTEICE